MAGTPPPFPPFPPLFQDHAGAGHQGFGAHNHLFGGGSTFKASSSSTSVTSTATSPCASDSLASTPEGMDCYGNERQALTDMARYFNNALLSDIKLKVGKHSYYAHKLLLVRTSEVFEAMLTSEWQDASKQEVELIEEGECVKIFPRFLKFLYTCHIVLNTDNTLPVLILADKYNVVDLRGVCIHFACCHIIPKLQLKDVFHVWFQYATKCYHQQLISACVTALSEKMDDITYSAEWEQEWITLDKEQLQEFLKSSDLTIKDEHELWQAVVRWVQAPNHPDRASNIESLLQEMLPYIRFPMMMPDQLCQLERSALVDLYPALFQPHLMQAYKYHSLSLTSRAAMKEFNGTIFLLRNYSQLRWDKRLVVTNYSQRHKCSEVSLRFSTRASTFPAQTWEWELKVYPKGFSSTSEDFRCILYSNLILDQPRPVEFLLSIVDNRRIICTVTGKKNFSKNRYTTDTEIDKKVSVADLCMDESPFLVNDCLIMQIKLKPVE